ncbi:MAG: response regulator, partial [Rhodocyclaceae bacterium]|nr:response regulator [Rhodocyclaceae bacterium]
GMAELLEASPLGPEQRNYVAAIKTSGETLLAIVSDILDYTNLDGGRVQLDHAPFDPRAVVAELHARFAAKAAEKRLAYRLDTAPDVPSTLCGDSRRLQQLLAKLLDNAIKFTERGSVELSLRLAGSKGGRAQIECAVRDTGIGFAPERLNQLFQPFETLDRSLTRPYSGTGMGLALCRLLCATMGGDISVDSSAGRGSTFLCRLPFDLPDPASTRVAGAVGGQGVAIGQTRMPVLVVEPDAARRELICAALDGMGDFDVSCAIDALECLEICARRDPGLIFVATHMHGLDGCGTTRALRSAGCSALIVCVGDDADSGIRDAAKSAGADDFLLSPLTGRAVRTAVARLLPCASAACA